MNNNDKESRGFSKKRKPFRNGLDRGSNFASIRKDANLLMVFSCVNGNKPTNVRYSTTPKGERLTDSYVSGLLSGITKSVKKTDARYRKGLKTLEPYEGKLSCTVPRRGKAGNRFFLSDKLNAGDDKIIENFDKDNAELIDSEKSIYGIKIVKPNSIKYFYFSESLREKQLEAKARTVLKKLQEAKEIQEIIVKKKASQEIQNQQ